MEVGVAPGQRRILNESRPLAAPVGPATRRIPVIVRIVWEAADEPLGEVEWFPARANRWVDGRVLVQLSDDESTRDERLVWLGAEDVHRSLRWLIAPGVLAPRTRGAGG